MKITAIKQQLKTRDRYSVYVDNTYRFSLSETALMDAKLHSGMELTSQQIDAYKQLSQDDKLYGRALRYVALRHRSTWEVQFYLERKGADYSLIQHILYKLSSVGLLDDEKFAAAFVNDHQLFNPTSRRKLIMELKKKHITESIIQQAVPNESHAERLALSEIIIRKRRQIKYQDDIKLMQYLARQGFGYSDIKSALTQADEDY